MSMIRAPCGALFDAQLREQLHWLGMRQGFEDIPALFLRGDQDGAQGHEVVCSLPGSEGSRDFLSYLDHAQIALGLIMPISA